MPIRIDCSPDGVAQSAADQLVEIGPTLEVDIGFDPNFRVGDERPILGGKSLKALIDTGAIDSFIDADLARALDLPLVDRRFVSGSSGRHEAEFRLAQIYSRQLHLTLQDPMGCLKLVGGGQTHSALLGRSFLQHCTLEYLGKSGRVFLTLL
jgi:hypothetical protein